MFPQYKKFFAKEDKGKANVTYPCYRANQCNRV